MKNSHSDERARLRLLRDHLGLTQKEIAVQVGIAQAYWSSLELGNRELTSNIIRSLSEKFNVSSDWLLFGEDSMFKKDVEKEVEAREMEINSAYNKLVQLIELMEKAFGKNDDYDKYISKMGVAVSPKVKESWYRVSEHKGVYLDRLNYLLEGLMKDFDYLFNEYFLDVNYPRRRQNFKEPKNTTAILGGIISQTLYDFNEGKIEIKRPKENKT